MQSILAVESDLIDEYVRGGIPGRSAGSLKATFSRPPNGGVKWNLPGRWGQ